MAGSTTSKICKLLQQKEMVVCPEGLYGELEPLQFNHQELPLWDSATPSKPAYEPQLITVDLSGFQAKGCSNLYAESPIHTSLNPSSNRHC